MKKYFAILSALLLISIFAVSLLAQDIPPTDDSLKAKKSTAVTTTEPIAHWGMYGYGYPYGSYYRNFYRPYAYPYGMYRGFGYGYPGLYYRSYYNNYLW